MNSTQTLEKPLYLCPLETVKTQASTGFYLDKGQSLIVITKGEALFVYLNQCPHRLVYLESTPNCFLDDTQQFIQCSSHGALFEIESGLCITGPCIKQSLTPIKFAIIDEALYIDSSALNV